MPQNRTKGEKNPSVYSRDQYLILQNTAVVSWSAFLQSFCQTFVAQEEKYQQKYLTSFKLALQIEEFHYWNWELMFIIFCRICGSLLRPFFLGMESLFPRLYLQELLCWSGPWLVTCVHHK